jgi:hypothetical protein
MSISLPHGKTQGENFLGPEPDRPAPLYRHHVSGSDLAAKVPIGRFRTRIGKRTLSSAVFQGSSSDQFFIRKTTASARSSTLHELAARPPAAPNLHGIPAVPHCSVDLGEQGWQDMGGEQIEIVAGAVEVGRHHRHEIAAMLPAVGLA